MGAEARVNIRAKAHVKEIARVKKALTGLRKTVLNLKTASVVLGGAAGMGLIIRAGLKQIDVIGKMSRLYRIATENIGAMTLAARVGGTDLNTMLKAARNTSRQMFDFSRGVGEAKDAMETMGVTADDIKPLLNDQLGLMSFLAEKINGVESATDRLAIAQDIFGGRATVVLNALEGGVAGMQAFKEEAKLLGGALTKDAVRGVEEANDSFTRLGFLLEGIRNQTVAALAPAIQSSVDTFKEWILEIAKADGGIKGFAQGMAISILRGVRSSIVGVQEFIDSLDGVREKLVSIGVLQEDGSKKDIIAQRAVIKNLSISIANREKLNVQDEFYNELLASREEAYLKLNDLQGGNNTLLDGAIARLDTLITSTENLKQVEGLGEEEGIAGGDGRTKVEIKQEEDDTILDMEIALQDKLSAVRKKKAVEYTRLESNVSKTIVSMKMGVYSAAAGLFQALAAKSKTAAIIAIAINKGLSIAQAIQNTGVAATKALAIDPTGAMMARVNALGATQVALIAATGLVQAASLGGGGGGASIGSPANPVNTTQASAPSGGVSFNQTSQQQEAFEINIMLDSNVVAKVLYQKSTSGEFTISQKAIV